MATGLTKYSQPVKFFALPKLKIAHRCLITNMVSDFFGQCFVVMVSTRALYTDETTFFSEL
ncbi:hypothetical protein RCH20_001863 [Psychrobacter sp. PL15]|nr:hypothetical protein [Psychrobacter sp. PL15]